MARKAMHRAQSHKLLRLKSREYHNPDRLAFVFHGPSRLKLLTNTWDVGGSEASESTLRSAGTLLSRFRAPPPALRPDGVKFLASYDGQVRLCLGQKGRENIKIMMRRRRRRKSKRRRRRSRRRGDKEEEEEQQEEEEEEEKK
ncbi:hypothetical protein PoB_002588400 [Plakobranchus ocellatus]|uniref:Uncharacterized protein n=1 Tax=Plakobranchus ocellatus TaxID=259542 RepID=A0AAV3ZYB3_9GAST|nr:hypothetical protein PoB_002588400 [Plakobranchus ocellatus]